MNKPVADLIAEAQSMMDNPTEIIGVRPVAEVFRDLVSSLESATKEMHSRELHHFETEKLLVEAGIDPDNTITVTPEEPGTYYGPNGQKWELDKLGVWYFWGDEGRQPDYPTDVVLTPKVEAESPHSPQSVERALYLLDSMNADGQLEYSVYSALHDAISTIESPAGPLVADKEAVRSILHEHVTPDTVTCSDLSVCNRATDALFASGVIQWKSDAQAEALEAFAEKHSPNGVTVGYHGQIAQMARDEAAAYRTPASPNSEEGDHVR